MPGKNQIHEETFLQTRPFPGIVFSGEKYPLRMINIYSCFTIVSEHEVRMTNNQRCIWHNINNDLVKLGKQKYNK